MNSSSKKSTPQSTMKLNGQRHSQRREEDKMVRRRRRQKYRPVFIPSHFVEGGIKTGRESIDSRIVKAIKARFGGNDATKKIQKALLKQQYENFNATSSESLDSIFNRLQKLVSRLAILGVDTSPEDFYMLSFESLLPSEWDTHVVVWMNKPDFETMGLDDLYNNFKIVEQKVKRTIVVNNNDKNLAFLTTSSLSSTNSAKKWVMDLIGSDMAEDEIQANMALMAFTDSEVSIDKSCSKSCLLNYEALKKQYDDLLVKLDDTAFKAATYKRGLSILEAQVVKYKESEVLFSEEIALLKRSVGHKDYLMGLVKDELEKVKEEKELKNRIGCQMMRKEVEYIPKEEKKTNVPIATKKESVKTVKPSRRYQLEPVLMKTGLKTVKNAKPLSTARSVNTARPFSTARTVNTVRPYNTAHPKSTVSCARPKSHFQNKAQLTVQRPFYKNTALTKRSNIQNINTGRQTVNTVRPNVNTVRARGFNAVKPSACWVWRPIKPNGASLSNSQLNDKGFVDSGCSRHMSGNIAHLSDFKDFDGGYVTFGGGANGGRITGKGTIKTDKLDFEDVYFVKELKFNLFSVSQMCDKKNYVLFTDSECLVLSPNFKLPDESQILLKIPRQNNMYSFDMKNIVPKDGLTCLVAKATSEESMLWHRRLGHVNFKNINKLVKENLVRDLPLKRFENDQTCVACLKGKQHRASCKTKAFSPTTKPLFMLHMDLFGPTFVSSLMHKKYCLVVTDDYSRFSWVFFLRTKDETSEILKNFIKEIENLVDKKVRISGRMTPQQNGVAERKNRTLIEAARTMLADSKLPITFWAEAVSTACYVQNRISWGKFDGKSNEGFFVGFLGAIYEGKNSTDGPPYIHAFLQFPFLKEEPSEFLNALSDHAWVIGLLVQVGLRYKEYEGELLSGTKIDLLPKGHTQVSVLTMLKFFLQWLDRKPISFEDPDHPDKVYKVVKALYGLHQAPRAWYDTLATYLLSNGFQRGKIDQTLFIKSQKDILLVQIYVDDIIFGSTKKELCDEFEKLMKDKFQMSSMGELTFFLGLQVQQKKKGIFINADDVDEHLYRSMIGSLMYLTASRPDIMFAVCACARDYPMELVAYTDSDYAGATLDRKSTTGEQNDPALASPEQTATGKDFSNPFIIEEDSDKVEYLRELFLE
ncbi:putative ribonuclease H-like domain-containing protein [Tanacetum coccineum]